jgi:hypothetical protein
MENTIKMDLKEIGLEEAVLDSSGSGNGPVVGSCEHGDGPSGSIECCEFLE